MTDAWHILVSLEQSREPDILKKKKHLMVRQLKRPLSNGVLVTQIVIGSRVKIFPIGFNGKDDIPYLPVGRLAELVAQKLSLIHI